MAATITVQDMLNQVNDHLANYTTGTIDLGNRLRALNRATEYIQRRLGLPSDETIFTFYYAQDQLYTTLPSDFNEPLQLLYHNSALNTPDTEWNFRLYPDVLRETGTGAQNLWSVNTINGKTQLLMQGTNLYQGATLNTFDALGSTVGQNNATNLSIDTNVYVEGSGSLKFDINPNLGGTGKGSIYWPVSYDFRSYHTNNAIFKLQCYLPSINFSSINLVFGSSAVDYYTFTATLTDAGLAFTQNAWNLISWQFASNPVIVGSPNDQAINFVRVDFVQNGSFGTSTVSSFRIDDFYTEIPDQMDLIYYSNYKCTDTSGTTKKFLYTANSDIPLFQAYAPDLINPISLRAAYILSPQIRGNKDFMSMYREDFEDELKVWGRVYPRKRIINYGKTHLLRS